MGAKQSDVLAYLQFSDNLSRQYLKKKKHYCMANVTGQYKRMEWKLFYYKIESIIKVTNYKELYVQFKFSVNCIYRRLHSFSIIGYLLDWLVFLPGIYARPLGCIRMGKFLHFLGRVLVCTSTLFDPCSDIQIEQKTINI